MSEQQEPRKYTMAFEDGKQVEKTADELTGEQVYACINPEVIEQSDELVDDQEGCLSFPGLILRVKRPRWIQAKYTNKHGETVEEKFEGLTARCYLHELDHMNGIRFVDKVGKVSLDKARRKQAKLIKAVERRRNG